MNYDSNEEMKYKKKSNKNPPTKTKHKHNYTPCVFEYNSLRLDKAQGFKYDVPAWKIGGYCPICGKIGYCKEICDYINPIYTENNWKYMSYLNPVDFYNDKAKKEFNPKTRTLPYFFIDNTYLQKYVGITKNISEKT